MEKQNKKEIEQELNKKDKKITEKNKSKKIDTKKQEEKINKDKKESTYHKYLIYLIIFSIIGLLIETICCFAESRIFNKEFSLILGPLCVIYGIGATITIICLERFKNHKIKLFILGAVLGTFLEYILSFVLEAIIGAKVWSYEAINFSINRRICLLYAPLWGILTVILINFIQKYIDKLINKVKGKTRIIVDIILTIFLIIVITLTIWGLITYVTRAKETLDGKNYTSNNNIFEKFQNNYFSNEIMNKLFKKVEIIDNEGKPILIKNING